MDSIAEDDPTLPIDFDQTSNFAQFLDHAKKLERQDSVQSDLTLSESINPPVQETKYETKKEKKRRSYSTSDRPPPERPSSRGGTMREQENIISELKKECFGLKMRIYYMEERLHDTFDASTEDIIKKNIELKVTIEELKQETREKSDLLSKASLAMEQMSDERENYVKQFRTEYLDEFNDTQAKYEDELNTKNKEITSLKDEIAVLNSKLSAEPGINETDGPSKDDIKTMENDMLLRNNEIEELRMLLQSKANDFETLETKQHHDKDSYDSKIKELQDSIAMKESNIEMLRKDVVRLAGSPERSNQHYKKLYERQGEELSDKDNNLHELKSELANKTHLAETYKEHIANAEKTIKNLRSNMHDKEMEKQRSVGHLQDQIKKLEAALDEKDSELDGKEKLLAQIKQEKLITNQQRVQFELDSLKDKDGQIVELRVQLKEQEYDIQKLNLLLEEKDKDVVFFGNSKLRAESELAKCKDNFAEQMKKLKEDFEQRDTSKQNKIHDLQEHCHQLQEKLQKQVNHKDKVIKHLVNAICEKDNMIQNLVDLSSECTDVIEEKNPLVEKLQQKLREKDNFIEKTVEEHYAAIQAKDDDISKWRRDTREKENVLERIESKCALLEEQFKNVKQSESDAKELMENMKTLLEKSSSHERELESRSCEVLKDKDTSITKMTCLLSMKDEEIQKLKSYLTQGLVNDDLMNDITLVQMKGLKDDVALKEELAHVKEDAIAASNLKNQELLSLLKDKEQIIQDLRKLVTSVQDDKNEVLKELNLQLISAEHELKSVNSALLRLKNSQELEATMFQETLNEKDASVESLVKTSQEKDRIISELKDRNSVPRSPSPSKMAEIRKLRQAVDMLKEDSDKKDHQLQELLQKNGALKEKLSRKNTVDVSNKDEKIDKMGKEIQQQNDLVKLLQSEKEKIQTEKDAICHAKELLQTQLEDALTKKTKHGGSHISSQHDLVLELEELIRCTEKEKEKYIELTEKLKNNQDPDSRMKLLEHELSEVEHLRQNLQQLLLSLVKRNAMSQSKDGGPQLQEDIIKLKKKLQDLENLNDSLAHQINSDGVSNVDSMKEIKDLKHRIAKMERDKRSLQDDLKRCEFEAKQVNNDLAKMKIDYEQLVHDRDEEISTITIRLNQLKAANDAVIKERDKGEEDLIECHKQFDLFKLQLRENKSILKKNQNIDELKNEVIKKDAELNRKEQLVNSLQKENADIRSKLNQAEVDLRQLNVNLEKMMLEMSKADADIATLETQLTANVETISGEKKMLKKDVKELCSINERLRLKIKDMTKAHEKLKSENELERNNLLDELQKAKQSIKELEEDILSRQRKTSAMQDEVIELQEKTNNIESMSNRLHCIQEENKALQCKVDECIKAEESQNKLLLPELTKLRDDVELLSNENGALKLKQSRHSSKMDEFLKFKQELLSKTKENKIFQLELKDSKDKNISLNEELTKALSKIDTLSTQLGSTCDKLTELQKDLKHMKESKKHLEFLLKELQRSEGDAKQKLSITAEENMTKQKHITLLTNQVGKLEEQIESFSPLHTSSQQNIALSSDAFTQTLLENTKPHIDDNSLIAMHIKEMRELRKQLEETIRNNDALRHQLEDRLSQIEHDASMINDPEFRISLVRDNDALRIKLSEHMATQKRMKQHIDELMKEKSSDKDTISDLHSQIHQLNELSTHLKTEMEAYDRLVRQLGIDKKLKNATPGQNEPDTDDDKLDKKLLKALLDEIRILRAQLKQCIDVNNALRQKLEQELGRPVSISPLITPLTQPPSAKRSLFSAVMQSVSISPEKEGDKENRIFSHNHVSPYETPTKDYDTFSQKSDLKIKFKRSPDICCLCGKLNDYSAMKRSLVRSVDLVAAIHKKLLSCCRKKDYAKVDTLLKDLSQAYKLVKDVSKLLNTFVVRDSEEDLLTENIRLKDDINRLKATLASKEHFIKSTLDIFDENPLWKNGFDDSITEQLIRARDTLKATKGNLQLKASQSQANSSAESSSLLHMGELHNTVDDEI